MHMTLGVMALSESEDGDGDGDDADDNGDDTPFRQPKTVSAALALLESLSPQISVILDGDGGVKVPLDVLDVLKAEKMRRRAPQGAAAKDDHIGAGVLFLGPRESRRDTMNAERRKLMDICGMPRLLFVAFMV
jgi:hypothetical protein